MAWTRDIKGRLPEPGLTDETISGIIQTGRWSPGAHMFYRGGTVVRSGDGSTGTAAPISAMAAISPEGWEVVPFPPDSTEMQVWMVVGAPGQGLNFVWAKSGLTDMEVLVMAYTGREKDRADSTPVAAFQDGYITWHNPPGGWLYDPRAWLYNQ